MIDIKIMVVTENKALGVTNIIFIEYIYSIKLTMIVAVKL